MRRLFLILASVILLAVSCERKVLLEPDHHHGNEVFVSVDVNAVTESDAKVDDPYLYVNILNSARSVTIIAYPKSEGARYGVHQIKGMAGSIWLMPGLYDLLIYTSDFYELDGTFYRGLEAAFAAEAYTNQVKSLRTKQQLKSYDMDAPDPLFVHFYEDFEVTEGENTLVGGMMPMVYKYWYEVDVDGLDYITSVQLEIDGMYTSVYMATGEHREEEYGTQRVESTIHKDENKIKGEFFSFGPHQDSEVKNSMILTFVNGRTIRVHLDDISPEIKKLTKGGEIVIDQKIVINVDDTGAGFVPEVEDWEEEEVVIPI